MRAAAAIALFVAAGCATAPPPPPPAAKPAALAAEPTGARAIHLAGDTPPAPAGTGAPGTVVEAAYDVCLDENARVASVTPAPGLAAADDAIAAALRHWSWFVVAAGPRPCWRERVLLGVPAPRPIARQASAGVVARAATRPSAPPPRSLSALYAGKVVDGVYKVCAGDDGRVQSVRSMVSAAGADPYLMAMLHATAWDIVVGTLAQPPYCFAAPMHLDFTSSPHAAVTLAPPPGTQPKEPGMSIVVPATR
ncbi:MAG: hypothetical protein JWM53_5577 [bacterium]|nr:hypothetical protein [bacterium]